MKITAIQGIEGSFHHTAAEDYLGPDCGVVPCLTFREVIERLERAEVDLGIMAVENTIAGSLLPNYQLILQTPVKIVGEVYARIEQNLMALPGQGLEDIRSVHSHPIALAQCREFFDRLPSARLVESEDTALSAREIAKHRIEGRAAIAGSTAAQLYGLEILVRGIETNKTNYTRFWVLSHDSSDKPGQVNKASLCFSLKHQTGYLARVLSVFADHGINLTKIQSLPILGTAWEYRFFVDLIFEDLQRYRGAMAAVKPMIESLSVLGEYREGDKRLV